MSGDESLELRRWVDAVERLIAERPCRFVKRVVALAETGSTQDAALAMSGGEGGLLVLAGRQSAGRGRLGRSWNQRLGLGVAATLTLRAGSGQRGLVSLAAGVAAAEAVEKSLGTTGLVGIRWPNDVVERERGRKIAGVLIEARKGGDAPLFLVGIGINVLQRRGDWPEELRDRAVSLAELGPTVTRERVILALVEALEGALAALESDDERVRLLERWREWDVLRGVYAAFTSGEKRYAGVVESVEPTLEIVLRLEGGERVRLAAESASLVHA